MKIPCPASVNGHCLMVYQSFGSCDLASDECEYEPDEEEEEDD